MPPPRPAKATSSANSTASRAAWKSVSPRSRSPVLAAMTTPSAARTVDAPHRRSLRRPDMSLAPSVALPRPPGARPATATGHARLRLLFAAIVLTSLSALALSVVSFAQTIGHGDALPDYAAIAPNRTYLWAFFLSAGVQLIVGACAAALAAWLLAPARGARWANVGTSIVWLGAAIYGVGIGGWATLYYFGTDTAALNPATAARLIDHANADPARMLAVPISGALLVALGSMLLAVALWRAHTVPRWVPILGAITAVTAIVLPPDTVAGVVGEAASAATSIAIGWYAWQQSGARPQENRI